jgi:hypothetical protein
MMCGNISDGFGQREPEMIETAYWLTGAVTAFLVGTCVLEMMKTWSKDD